MTLDACNFLKLTQDDVKALLELMCEKWSAVAQQWWDAKLASDASLQKYDACVKSLLICRPLVLQLESTLCEQGNRQKKAEEGITTKGKWTPCEEDKALAYLRSFQVDAKRKVTSKPLTI
jgi:hypothetical protein